ncbi:MAG: hypothetical protein OXG81_13680 [Acidobacteria bacterium]|nr:hypothetical protein [Acidobacteriota bacterium]MCY4122954.1 hypothetical protein [Acidobacteriota bacterium]
MIDHWYDLEDIHRDFPRRELDYANSAEFDLWLLETIAAYGKAFPAKLEKELNAGLEKSSNKVRGGDDGYLITYHILRSVGDLKAHGFISEVERGPYDDVALTPLGRQQLFALRSDEQQKEAARKQAIALWIAAASLVASALMNMLGFFFG